VKNEAFFILGLLPTLFGCSLNYREAMVPEEIEDAIPNIVMTNVTHVSATKEHLLMRARAQRSESYEKSKKTVLTGVEFTEYDSQGTLVAEGRADKITYFSNSKDAQIEGRIRVHSLKEKGAIDTDYLYWDDKNRILRGKSDVEVSLVDDDGSKVSGTGFEADLKRMVISFVHAVKGEYVVSDRD